MKKHFKRSKEKVPLSYAQKLLDQWPFPPLNGLVQLQWLAWAPTLRRGLPRSFHMGRKPAIAEPGPALWSSSGILYNCVPYRRCRLSAQHASRIGSMSFSSLHSVTPTQSSAHSTHSPIVQRVLTDRLKFYIAFFCLVLTAIWVGFPSTQPSSA